ncbi:MAG: Fic family protein, partial [Candidatus Aenigmarchaeota archaeon]|nr:Fic family protein [Candidatus Aenigmarchaeota archaeon]
MTYVEVKERDGKKYIYLVKTIRTNGGWKKLRKYVGENVSRETIEKEKKAFEKTSKTTEFLNGDQINEIEEIRQKFDNYKKKAGTSGLERFNEWFFTELTYNSNAIEGTSLSLRETSMIINENIIPKSSTMREVNEAKNHKEALDFMLDYKGDVNEKLVLKIHSFILKNIDNKNAGNYRKVNVFIYGEDVKFPSPKEVPGKIRELIRWYKTNKSVIHPIDLAIIFSMKFVSIHPFTDGNGRVSRLLMNYILRKNHYPEINIYVKDRANYIKAVRKANEESYEMIIDFAVRTMKKNYEFLE